jgi:acyl-CoA reductase-like NAD-dependent aldehyde dehydrogenase
MLPIIDILHKLFVEKQVVALKLNPVNAHLGPLIEEGFKTFIDRGFMRVVYGGVAEGSYLCNHRLIDELHLTGSDKTYEAIVFGTGEEGKRQKADRKPVNTKRFTAELGNVNPVIIIPGPWKRKDVIHQARQISSWLVSNAGFGCLTPRIIIQHESWPYRQHLMDEIGKILDRVETRKAYYTGAKERHQKFLAAHPEARQYGDAGDEHLPWTIIPDVDPQKTSDICFRQEAFCSLLAETVIDAPSVETFIEESVRFSNQILWGTLCATLIVHSKSLKNSSVKESIRMAISKLRYGTVAVNMFTFYSAYLMLSPWGAFPGHDIFDIQSGIGKVTNFLMFRRPEKSIILAPFKRIDPLTVASKRPHVFGRKMAEYEENPTWWKLPSLLWATFRCYV